LYHAPLIPPGTDLVTVVETDRFRIRPMTIHDVVRDYEAVASSPGELGAAFGDPDAVPQPYTFEQEIIELGWHQKEFQMGFSFVFIVVPLDEHTSYGNVYIFPASRGEFDAEVYTWVRKDQLATGLGDELFETVQKWVAQDWPFERVAYPGREVPWPEWEALAACS
jgi:RimJ/RimL family protein N-acetyltransferase